MASTYQGGTTNVWNANENRLHYTLDHDSWLRTPEFSSDRAKLSISGKFGTMIWDTSSFEFIEFIPQLAEGAGRNAVSVEGEVVAENDGRSSIVVSDGYENRTEIFRLVCEREVRYALSPNGTELATVSGFTGPVRIWDLERPRMNVCQCETDSWFQPLAVSPSGDVAAMSGPNGTIRLWHPGTGETSDYKGHSAPVLCVCFSPDGSYLLSAGEDKCIILWDAKSMEIKEPLTEHESSVWTVSFSHTGRQFVSGDTLGQVRVWDTETLKSKQIASGMDLIRSLKFSPEVSDGRP